MTTSIPELSVDTLTLEKLLEAVEPGEMVGYEILSDAIGRDVRHRARHVLDSARSRLLKREPRENRMVFEAVEGKGLKRLDSIGCLSLGEYTLGKIRRASQRGANKIACATYDELSREDQIRFNAHLANLGAINLMTKPAAIKRLNEAVRAADKALITSEVLALFAK